MPALAFDVGGTKIAAALVDGLVLLDRRESPTPRSRDVEEWLAVMAALARGWSGYDRVSAAVTGIVRDGLWTALNPDILSVLMVSPERMSILHLSAYTRHLAENKQKTQRYDIALWKKLVYPLAALVMVALALPFGYTHNRVSGVSLKIFSGVMIGVFFHMLNGLFSNLGAINNWSPALSAIEPPRRTRV